MINEENSCCKDQFLTIMECSDISLAKECLWCSHTCWMRERMDMLIQLMECSLDDQPEWFQQMCKDLSCCSACVEQYHNAMKTHPYGSKRAIVYNWNCRRINDCLEEGLRLFNLEMPLDIDEFCEESITLCIETAIKEVLKYPKLMLNEQISTLCLQSLKMLLKRMEGFELHERLQGLCLLLVNQDPQVSKWAVKTFKSFGSIDCDEYDELESVINWLLDVIILNLFVNCDDLTSWEDTENVLLPRHLFTSKPRDFWLGIYTVMTAMTKSCMQTCLLTSRKELLASVLAFLAEDSDKEYNIPDFSNQPESYRCKNTIFWPVLQCFVLLVDKLGSRFWILTGKTPNSVLKLIKTNPYHQLQLDICYSQAARLDLAKDIDNDLSFSQLVYDDTLSSKLMEPVRERYHGFSLSWVVPFIKSLIDFGDCESSTVVELLDFVCYIHSVSLHGNTDVSSTDSFQAALPIRMVAERVESLFLSQESLKCISQSVDVLFSQKVYSVLLQCKQAIFCMITVLCSYVLSRGRLLQSVLNKIKQHLSQTARTYTSLVMYCSTEKTASKLWYLVKQISSLSPFLSTISNQVDSSHSLADLQPDKLCSVLLRLIADKQDNQDIAGPFLYPPSVDTSTFKKPSSSITVIKQEPCEEDSNNKPSYIIEVKQEPLLDHGRYHQEHSSHSKGSDIAQVHCLPSSGKITGGNSCGGSEQRQVSLKLKKLPIEVSKSDNGTLQYTYNSILQSRPSAARSASLSLTEPMRSHVDSDTESCSSNSDDDLPSYLFPKRRSTDASTSSTVTIGSTSELIELSVIQKTTAKEELVKNHQALSRSTHDHSSKSEINNVICNTKNFSSAPLDCCILRESSEEDDSKVKENSIKLKTESNVKRNILTELEQNTDFTGVNKTPSIIDMVLLDGDDVSGQCVAESDALVEQRESIGSELQLMENADSGDEDVFAVTDNQHTLKLSSSDKQQSSNSTVDDSYKGSSEPMQCENEQYTKSYIPSTADKFLIVPNKHRSLKFNFKSMEPKTNLESSDEATNQINSDSVNNYKAKPQLMINDKVQPAVAGRAPFSKSRMAHIPSALNSITKVQATKAKGNAISKDLHRDTLKATGQVNSEASKVVVKVELTRAYSKEEFLMEVLRWNPTAFDQSQGSDVVTEGPYSLPSIAKVPLRFESSDQYVEVFKPLLLLETWDMIKEEMKHAQEPGKTLCAKIEDCNLSSVTDAAYHRLTCKGIINTNDTHPFERDLVCIKCILQGTTATSFDFPVMFGIVESISKRKHFTSGNENLFHSSEPSNLSRELTLHLSINRFSGSFHVLSDNLDVEILTVVSLSSFVRQWEGLIAISRNMLCRDLLCPRNNKYFGYYDDTEQIAEDREYQVAEFSFNASQFEAITLSTKALSLPYCIPQTVLLQGPPGTGKTHTIMGIITSFFINQKLKVSSQSTALPGHNRLAPPKPHLLVCTPSNAGIDVVINRLMINGLVVGTDFWKRRHENLKRQNIANVVGGFRVVRVGVPEKIDPKVLPVFLDEIVKKKTFEASKKLQSLKEEIAKIHDQIMNLTEQITSTQKMIMSLKHGNKDDQLCCKELHANVNDLLSETRRLRTEHQKLTRESTACSSDIKRIQQKVLLEADIICCTLTSSGCQKLRECFQSKPQHFTAVIVDEAAQCSELLTLIPLLYHSTKLVLVGDPAQLPSTVKSQTAERLGYGQSLFERFFQYFTRASYNPIKMLQIQYRMNSKICQFPSEQFYHGKLLTHSSCDKEVLLKPLLVFDLYNGTEDVKDGSSYSNELECQLIIKICNLLLEVVTAASIGIIAPYKAQVKMIQKNVISYRKYHNIEIGTVDSYQGREKDVILLSCVRVQRGGSIGFLTDQRRLNVAITRAKRALYIIGHLRTFQYNKHWNNLITHAEKQNVIVRVDKDMNCAKECLIGIKASLSVSVTEDQTCSKKGKAKNDEIQCVSSSHSTVMVESTSGPTITNAAVVDRSAFAIRKNSVQIIDALPKLKTKNSPSKNTSSASRRKSSSSHEPERKEQTLHTLPKKVRFSSTDHINTSSSSSKCTKPNTVTALNDKTLSSAPGKQKATQATDEATKQKSKQISGPSHRAELTRSTSQATVQTVDDTKLSLSTKTGQVYSAVVPSLLTTEKCSDKFGKKTPSDKTIFGVPSNMAYSYSRVNIHGHPSTSRQVEFSNDSKRTDGQKMHSHSASLSGLQQGTKRDHGNMYNDPRSKKAKYN